MPPALRWTQRLFPLFCVLAISCQRGPSIPDGDVAGALGAIPVIGTQPFAAKDLAGKPALVMFVSPMCEHCVAEMPRASAAAAEAKANLVAVFVVGKQDDAEAIAKSTHFAGPILMDDGSLRKKYDITGVPYTLVLKPDGHAVAAFAGEQDEATIRNALAEAR